MLTDPKQNDAPSQMTLQNDIQQIDAQLNDTAEWLSAEWH